MRQNNKQFIIFSLIFLELVFFKFVQSQQIVCKSQTDCKTNECCNQGTCQTITDETLRQYCSNSKKCYASQCQYGCCTSNQQCGSYSDCNNSQDYQIQIIISIVVGVIVVVLLVCYIYAVCKNRKRSQVMSGEEESESNVERNDRTIINQTNQNQTQHVILNHNANQTSLTEQNYNNTRNNLDKSIQKPTHVLPPINTIFLIDQNRDQPIFVQKKLDVNDIDSINHSIQGTRVSKEYFMRKKRNRLSQRGNASIYSNTNQQPFAVDQERQINRDGQIISFNRINQQNFSQIDNNDFNLQKLETNQSQQLSKQDDLLKNPDNYLYQILRQLRQQVYVKKRSQSNQRYSRQMHSESDLSQLSNLGRNKIQSLHNENVSSNKNFDMAVQSKSRKQQSEQNLFQNENSQIDNIFNKNTTFSSSLNEAPKGYEQEIMINRKLNKQRSSNDDTYKINIKRIVDADDFRNEVSYEQNSTNNQQNKQKNGMQLNSNDDDDVESLNTPNQQSTLQTPHLENPITPHDNQDNTQRFLNQNESASIRSIKSKNLMQILQNQIKEEQQNKQSKSRNSKNNLEVPKPVFNNRNMQERKSQSSNEEDLIQVINNIYQDENELSKGNFDKSQENVYKMQDLLDLEQLKSQTISDSIYELEKKIDNIHSQNDINNDDFNLENQFLDDQLKQNQEDKSSNNFEQHQQLKNSQTQGEKNNTNQITQLPRILTLSQFQQN